MLYKERTKKKHVRKLIEMRKWDKRVGQGVFVAMCREDIPDVLTWLGKRNQVSKLEIETTLMKPWEFRARKLSNRKWICGDIDDDALWKEDGEMMVVWRLLGDDEKMKKESRDSDVIVVKGGKNGRNSGGGIKIYTPEEIANMRRKKTEGKK